MRDKAVARSMTALVVFALVLLGTCWGAQAVFAGTGVQNTSAEVQNASTEVQNTRAEVQNAGAVAESTVLRNVAEELVILSDGLQQNRQRSAQENISAEAGTGSITVSDIAYYDVWKHIDGTWQFGKKPGSSVSASFEISVAGALPAGARVTGAAGRYDTGYAGLFSEACVPQASVSVDGHTESTLLYTVQTTLAGEAENLRQPTQSEYTEGYRYYIPVTFEVQYVAEGAAGDGWAGGNQDTGGNQDKDGEQDAGGNQDTGDGTDTDGGADSGDESADSAGGGPALGGEANLYLPQETYEGHSVIADDRSVFEVDGKIYGAAHMYEEGLAANSFKAYGCQGRVSRENSTSAEVTFNSAGSASVMLTVKMADDTVLTDREEIDVLDTPSISASLGGTQKQNRKQVLSVDVAVNPIYPLEELWIEIEEKGNSENEKVHLLYDLSGDTESGAVNTDLIKTRPIKDAGTDSYFVRTKLEFLTKNTETKEMTYRIYACDERGNTDVVTSDFVVVPDQPPQALISTAKEHIREEGKNTAQVHAQDASISDGDDLSRTWYVRESGETEWHCAGSGVLSDASFGTWQSVVYEKEGVGKLEFRLDVCDKWTEETLEEYVDESEILTGSAVAETDVINIAPVVSLNTYSTKKTYELVLADGALYDADEVTQEKLSEEKEMLEKGISRKTMVQEIKTGDELCTKEFPESVFSLERGYGYGMEGTFLEKNWYMADGDTLYTVDGTWTQNTGITNAKYYSVGAPYTINAYNLVQKKSINEAQNSDAYNEYICNKDICNEDVCNDDTYREDAYNNAGNDLAVGDIKWTITITSEQLGGAGISEINGMAQDDTGAYLFFRTKDKTFIYDKRNGAYIGALRVSLGEDNYAVDEQIYTVKADGVYSVNMRSGNVSKIYDGNILMKQSYCDGAGSSRRVHNAVHFLTGKGKILTRAILNLDLESLSFAEMFPEAANNTSSFVMLGFGANGDVAVAQDGKSRAYVFDIDGNQLGCFSGWDTLREHEIVPAYKADGNFDYVAALANSYSKDDSYKYYGFSAALYKKDGSEEPIKHSYTRKEGGSGTSGSGYDAGRVMYAVQSGDDVVVNMGNWSTSISDGSPLSAYYYTHFSQLVFDTEEKTATPYAQASPDYGALNAGNVICEYGKVTDDYVISAYSRDSAAYAYDEGVNKQALVVARLPKTEEEEISQTVNKFLPDRAAAHGGGVYDSVKVSLYGETLADITAEDGMSPVDKYNESPVLRVRSEDADIGGDNGEGTINKDNEIGKISTISKVYNLLPGTQYFYELEYIEDLSDLLEMGDGVSGSSANKNNAGIIEFEFVTDKVGLDSENKEGESINGNAARYKVTHIEKEDFYSDENLNSFFSGLGGNAGDGTSRVRDEECYIAELCFGKSGTQTTLYDSRKVIFEVPEGEKALLSFDYAMAADFGGVDQVYVNINGERWYRNYALSASSGNYTHPFILPEGENTIEFVAKSFGWRPKDTYIKIDNLQVAFIEREESTVNGEGGLVSAVTGESTAGGESMVNNANGGNVQKISGAITTPQEVVSYAGQEMLYINGSLEEAKEQFDFITQVVGESQNELTIDIPEGMAAVHTAVTVNHSVNSNNALIWSFDGKTVSVYKKTTTNYYPIAVPSPFRANISTSEGSIAVAPVRMYKASGGYENLEMFLINEEGWNSSVAEGKYFAEPEADLLYYRNETFEGEVRITISGNGVWGVKDFRLSRIENGRRIYEEQGGMAYGDEYDWIVQGGSAAVVGAGGAAGGDAEGEGVRVYRKGESVLYNVIYSDYENDPSKRQYWRYTHTPSNGGAHPDAGAILDAPITEFYIDGKYVAEHWQEDSAGNADYDKLSNVVTMTFYIEGAATAPWITEISTTPAAPEDGDRISITVGVDDIEKDALSLTIEVFEENVLIHTIEKDSITADGKGRYPLISTGALPKAVSEGTYTVVCTVRDANSAGIESYRFTVIGGFAGMVEHYPAWEEKRLAYNAANPDRPRGKNTYWAAEAFKVSAQASGNPNAVIVHIAEYPSKKVTLSKMADGTYGGRIYDKLIAADLAKQKQCELTFVFTALYSGGRRESIVKVQIDDGIGSGIKIHRIE